MWNFKASFIGTAIAVFLMLISLFVQFIYMKNVEYKYKKYDSTIKFSGAKNAKEILSAKDYKVIFKIKRSYFESPIDIKKSIIRLDYSSFNSSNIFDQVNSLFIAYKFVLIKKHNSNIYHKYKMQQIVNSLLALNLLWILVFGLWIIVSIVGMLLIFSTSYAIIRNWRLDAKASMLTWQKLRVTTDFKMQGLIQKFNKYKKVDSLRNILIVFSAPILSTFTIFSEWGRNE